MRRFITNTFIAITVFFSCINVVSAEDSIDNDLRKLIEEIHSNKPLTKISDKRLKVKDPNSTLALLKSYKYDTSPHVRKMLLKQAVRIARLHPTRHVKQEVVHRLTESVVNPKSVLRPDPYRWALSFVSKDFNNETKLLIRSALDSGRFTSETIRLCGVAGIAEELPRLKKLCIDELQYQEIANKTGERKWYLTQGWNARLARARMGDKEDIEKCIALVEAETNIETIALRLLPDIGYIRHPKAIECLQRYLNSDERLSPEKSTALGSPISVYAMNILTECLDNYPVKKHEDYGYTEYYTQQEIDKFRKWMSQQKNWSIKR